MADITDEQIAAAVRPLYADDTAASMGLADDIRTVRAVLALREQEASATGAATDDTLWKRRAYHLDRELKAARVDVDSEIVEGQLADFLLKFGGKYDGNGMWEVSLHLEEICQIMSALATPTTSTTGKVDASRVRDEALEEAATLCVHLAAGLWSDDLRFKQAAGANECAGRIRSLIGTTKSEAGHG